MLPRARLEAISRKFTARAIPWQFVDVIEPDPARRVKLRIEHERLADIHPSELADILEDLAPAEREAVFTSLDEEVAAETLEEVEPKLQKGAARKARRRAHRRHRRRDGPRRRGRPALRTARGAVRRHSRRDGARGAAGGSRICWSSTRTPQPACMTTEFVYLGADATVAQGVQALRSFDGDPESVTEIFLLDEKRVLRGAISAAAPGHGAARDRT
jgi:magnesium transporter